MIFDSGLEELCKFFALPCKIRLRSSVWQFFTSRDITIFCQIHNGEFLTLPKNWHFQDYLNIVSALDSVKNSNWTLQTDSLQTRQIFVLILCLMNHVVIFIRLAVLEYFEIFGLVFKTGTAFKFCFLFLKLVFDTPL